MRTTKDQQRTNDLIEHWREVGPIDWAESPYGWIAIDGRAIKLTPWQRAILSAWWKYRQDITTLAISNVKKTGKTFLNAVLLAWRWLALPGEHFAVGNDLDQSSSRQFQEISAMVRRNEYLKANCRVTSKQLIFEPTGSLIIALPVDAAGNAGANHITASHTEAWGIIYESGIRAFEELTPPPGLFYGLPTLRISDSYSGFEGESETWHRIVDKGILGERVDEEWPILKAGGLLLFHIDGLDAQQRCFRGTPEEAILYYDEQRTTLRPGTYQRFHENKRSSGSEAFIAMDKFDECIDNEHRPRLPNTTQHLYIGVDASIKHDSASVVAVHYDRSKSKVVLALHRIWQPSGREPLDIDGTIGAFLREIKGKYRIAEVRYDPYQLHDLSTRLRSNGLRMVEFPQSVPNLTSSGQNLYELIMGRNLVLYPDENIRRCASHAVAIQTSRGWRIAKEKTSYKIDVIVALAMAALGAIENGTNYGWSRGPIKKI